MFTGTVLAVLLNIIFFDMVLLLVYTKKLWLMFPSDFVGGTVEEKASIEVKFATIVLKDLKLPTKLDDVDNVILFECVDLITETVLEMFSYLVKKYDIFTDDLLPTESNVGNIIFFESEFLFMPNLLCPAEVLYDTEVALSILEETKLEVVCTVLSNDEVSIGVPIKAVIEPKNIFSSTFRFCRFNTPLVMCHDRIYILAD